MPRLLSLGSIQSALQWYEQNLCNADLRDPRGFRVRFQPEHFVHHIKMVNKFGLEPKNRNLIIQEIKSGKLHFIDGRYSVQRASEIPWAIELATDPDFIVRNWQALGTGDENYVKNFGTEEAPQWRVLVCKVIGQTRHFSTIFPCEMKNRHLETVLWP